MEMLRVNSKIQLIQALMNNQTKIKSFGVKQLGLFGSFVRNEQTNDSDVDFIVEFEKEKKTYNNFLGLAEYLESLLGRKVEIVTPQSLSPFIGPHIIKTVEYVALAS
jgi:predicted nucleotidyltransferase